MMNNIIDRYAKYTIVFNNLLELDPNFIWEDLQLDTNEHTQKFKDMFIARWGLYEIGGETIPQFKEFIRHRFNEYVNYYIEKINAYDTEIDMLDGIVETYTEQNNDTASNNSQLIDLPNKQTSKEYITSKTKDETTNERFKNIRRRGGVNVINLKKDYLKLIQDIYKEFVDKFDTCFIQIFN